ncbi:MAG TPA: caspase family protein [Kofleriaceae bacterium]|jgi:hypothetical protein|nr:caspase family protein [Kofleriaceae bacterium]
MAGRKAPTPNRKALVVGINDYPGEANDLPSCVDDAKSFSELLRAEPYGFQDIRTLLDGQATIKAVSDGLAWLCGQSSPGGAPQDTSPERLVFYYSGHGFRTEKDGVLRECLCLQDGFFFDNELVNQTQGLPPGVLTIILDSCHSGGMNKRFFEALAGPGNGSKEPVERVRVKTWMPEAAELVKLFKTEDEAIPFKPFGCAVIPPRTAAKGKQVAGAAAKVKQAKESAEAQVNGLLITACQADQTASASSSQTQGRSAFTFCLLSSIGKLGQTPPGVDGLATSELFQTVAQELASYQFQQTPALIEPPSSPGLSSRTFVTLQPVTGSSADASQPAVRPAPQPGAAAPQTGKGGPQAMPPGGTATTTTSQGDSSMTTQSPDSAVNEADAALRAVLPVLLPDLLQYHAKSYQPGAARTIPGQDQVVDDKTWWPMLSAAVRAAPSIWRAIQGKDFQPEDTSATASVQPPAPPATALDEKSWRALLAAAVRAAPALYQAFGAKGYHDGGLQELGLKAWQQARDAQSSGATAHTGMAAPPYSTAMPPVSAATAPQGSTIDDKSWRALLAAAIRAAPGFYQAYQAKDFQPGSAGAPAPQFPTQGAPQFPTQGAQSPTQTPGATDTNLQELGLKAWQQAKNMQPADLTSVSAASPALDDKVLRLLPVILPGVVQAMQGQGTQGKDFQATGGVTRNDAMPGVNENSLYVALKIAQSVAPMI